MENTGLFMTEFNKNKTSSTANENMYAKLDEVLNSDDHKWYLDKLDPEEKAKRAKAAAEFKARYDD